METRAEYGTQESAPPEGCERCHMDMLPLEPYPVGYPSKDLWLCEICANLHPDSQTTKNLRIIAHILYAKLLDIETKLDTQREKAYNGGGAGMRPERDSYPD